MESLQIRTGEIRLNVLDDAGESRGIFKFNPHDIESAKRVLSLQSELEQKEKEFDAKVPLCKTPEEQVELLDDVVNYFRELIDSCFGEGSSNILFGENRTLSMFDDFFTGIIPYYTNASSERMAKYKKTTKTKKATK